MKIWKPLHKLEEAEKIILGVPFSAKSSSYKGSEKAPGVIRKAFQNYWTYDLNRGDLFDKKIVDLGDLKKTNSYSTLEKELNKKIKEIKKKNSEAQIIFIGGDHSITPIITKALKINTYLCLDAHFDLMDKYGGDKNSHACSNRRIYEQGVDIKLRGIRSAEKEEHMFAIKNNLNWSQQISFSGMVDYFSFDADVLDPIYLNSGTPEALGFSPEQVIEVIRNTNFKYFDLVEWIPPQGNAYAVQILKEVLWK